MKLCGGLELDTASLKPGSRAPKDLALHEGRIGERQYEQRPHTCLRSLSHGEKCIRKVAGAEYRRRHIVECKRQTSRDSKALSLPIFPGSSNSLREYQQAYAELFAELRRDAPKYPSQPRKQDLNPPPETFATLQSLPALILAAWQHERPFLGNGVVRLGGLLRGCVDNPEHGLAVQRQADHDCEVSCTLYELLKVKVSERSRPGRGRGARKQQEQAVISHT